MELDYLRIALSLLASVALGVGIIYLMSRYGIGRGRKPNSAKRIEILEAHALGNRSSLLAVRYAGDEVLLVVGPGFATVAMVHAATSDAQSASSPSKLPDGKPKYEETDL